MHHLSIDLETYSTAPLPKTGVYRYTADPAFEILLLAYSVDGSDTQVIDLAQGEGIPAWLAEALVSPEYVKHAHNAAFEMACLGRHFGREMTPTQWRCTMLHCLYLGYPGGLEAAGKALGLPEDRRKMATGKSLIRFFCGPCEGRKANGGRTRNHPHHDPDKWALFKAYCRQDVETEMEIARRLEAFPVPAAIQRQWETDITINTRGVCVDRPLVQGAQAMDAAVRAALTQEAVSLSGVQNPGSVAQLLTWLEDTTGQRPPDLRKDTVSSLLKEETHTETTRRMLQIRQELCKTSVKKYDAIEAAVCPDGRVRGLLQFYGASRTGRWAGRLVQVQNLPRTYIEPLDTARELVKCGKTEALRLLYGPVADTLSQLIRTALVASPGRVLVDADFSAIEARVLSWLAGEAWRLEVFRSHGKIYEASASQMFGVPLERIKKGNPEYALRQKGKVAELALGYQGGSRALIAMGALEMGLTEAELPDIVTRWREANPRIVSLWHEMEGAALQVTETGRTVGLHGLLLARELDRQNDLDFLTVRLPSGRKLYYAQPSLGQNRWGGPSLACKGIDQTTKRWTQMETYGGKLTENVVQAIARDCLAEAVERLERAGWPVVFHVHDEVVIECEAAQADLAAVTAIMGQPMPWAPDLPLKAEGWVGNYFKKD